MRRLTAVLVPVVALAFLVLASTAAGAAPSGQPNPQAAVEAFATVPSWGTYGDTGRRRRSVTVQSQRSATSSKRGRARGRSVTRS